MIMYRVDIIKRQYLQGKDETLYRSQDFDSAEEVKSHYAQKREEIKNTGYVYSFSGRHYYCGDGSMYETYEKEESFTNIILILLTI